MNQNFFIIMVITFLLVLLAIYFLNLRTEKNSNNFSINIKILKTITESLWYNRSSDILYLPYKKQESLQEEISNMFIKIIIMLSEKNKDSIRTSPYISEGIKNKFLENLENISILPIEKILNINILDIIHHKDGSLMNVKIRSKLLNNSKEVEDTMIFIKKDDQLLLESIWVNRYRDKFIYLMDFLQKNTDIQNQIDDKVY